MPLSLLRWYILALAVFMTDQATKYAVLQRFRLSEVMNVLPHLNLVYYRNTGSAFGLFRSLGNPFFITVSFAAIAAVAMLLAKERHNRFGYALVLGGAAGNLLDRIVHGYVVDFVELYAGGFYWPAFNVADSALTVGIALLFWAAVRHGSAAP